MWICLECGHVFEQPAEFVERHGLDRPPYERITGCPAVRAPACMQSKKAATGADYGRGVLGETGSVCGGSYTKAGICSACGALAALESLEEGLCEACQTRVLKAFQAVMDSFTPDERRFLNQAYDGRWF